MTLPDRITEIQTAMSDFDGELARLLSNRTTHVASLTDAQTLGNLTADQVTDLLRAKIRAHIQTLGQNAHHTSPDDLGTYNQAKIDGDLGALMGLDSGAPLSFYGDREYLPPSVTGSFESGVNWAPWGFVGMFLEDNGTLMMLRTGTDGTRAGVYYSYLRNALTAESMADIVMTNTRYHPAYFPAGSVARAVLYSNQDLIIGILHDQVSLAITGYFISLTNNTFDQTKHTGIVIPAGTILNPAIVGESALRGQPVAFLKDNTVYLLVNKDTVDYEAAGWKVYSIPKSQLVNSSYQGATPVLGWTINRGSAGTALTADLDWAGNKNDVCALGNAQLSWVESHRANPACFTKTESDGKMVLSHGLYYIAFNSSGLLQPYGFHGYFVFDFDPITKVVDVSKYFNNKPLLNLNAAGTGYTLSNAPAVEGLSTPNSPVAPMEGQTSARIFLADSNVAFVYSTQALYTSRVLYRYTLPPAANARDILRGAVSATEVQGAAFEGRYASPVSFLTASVANIGDQVLVGRNTGWNKQNRVEKMWFRAGTNNGFVYRYGSLQGFNFMGFPPTPDRAWLADYPACNQTDMHGVVNETDATGYKVHKARYDSLQLKRRSGAANIDTSVYGTGTVSITDAACAAMEAQLRSALTSLIGAGHATYANLWWEIVVPQRYGDLPAFVHGVWVTQDRRTHVFVVSLTVDSRTATTSATVNTGSLVHATAGIDTLNNGLGVIGGSAALDAGQVCLRRVNTGFLVGLTQMTRYSYVGNGVTTVLLLSWKPGIGWAFAVPPNYDQQTISITNWVNFSHGLYLTFTAENHRLPVDCGTKLLATLVSNGLDPDAANLETYRTRFTQDATARIILSQQTASAWTVYFADPTAAMVDGLYQEVPLTTIVLNPTTDANKMIYVWLTRKDGVLSYLLTQSIATPTGYDGLLYLGYIQTNSLGIVTVNVPKRVAIGGKLLSTDSRGQAIPLTSGVPTAASHLNWR